MRVVVLVGLLAELALVLLFVSIAFGHGWIDDVEPASETAATLVAVGALAVAGATVWAMFARRAQRARHAILGAVGVAHLAAAVSAYGGNGSLVTLVLAVTGLCCLALALRPVSASHAAR